MLGPKLIVRNEGREVALRPPKEEELDQFAKGFSDLYVRRFTSSLNAPTLEMEKDWFKKVSTLKDEYLWVIETPWSEGRPIGVTSISNIDYFERSCMSGIVIWDKNSWGKRVASDTHIARTWFAARWLNRATIYSHVVTENAGSYRALQGVGYCLLEPMWGFDYRNGRYYDGYNLIWTNPADAKQLFAHRRMPAKVKRAIQIAKQALELGDKIIDWGQPQESVTE